MNSLIKNHVLIFWRYLLKHKSQFLLNLLGLSLGISCFLFCMIYVFYETSYDDYHANKDRIARMVMTLTTNGTQKHSPLGQTYLRNILTKDYPEIEQMVRFIPLEGKAAIKAAGHVQGIYLGNAYYVDRDVFKVFSYRLIEGDEKTCLSAPNGIVLTKRMARSLFGSSPALGRDVLINDRLLRITGVMDDIPRNSDLFFTGLMSMKAMTKDDDGDFCLNYILFKSRALRDAFQPKLNKFTNDIVNQRVHQEEGNAGTSFRYDLEPLTAVHFMNYSVYDTPKGSKTSVIIFLTMGILILVISFTNCLNMMVVKSFSRSLEIAIQKIYGANRIELIIQQFVESMVIGITATVIAVVLVGILLPEFSGMLNRPMIMSDLLNWKILAVMIAGLVILGVSGALYTGFYLGQIKLSDAIRSRNNKGYGLSFVPKMMLGFQFFISIGVIVAALLVGRQINYLRNAPLGFNPMNVLVVELPLGEHAAEGDKYLRNELISDPDIVKLSLCGENSLPGNFADLSMIEYRERNVLVKRVVDNISVDNNYLSLLQVPFLAGQDFHEKKDTFSRDEVIVTQSFAGNAGWSDPMGQRITFIGDTAQTTAVVGVVPDFHFNSLHNPIAPIVISQDPSDPAYLLVRVSENKAASVIQKLEKTWKNAFPAFPFSYYSLDQHVLQEYKDDANLSTLLLAFSILIIAISSVGLIAYLSYIVRIALSDIAIRRIIGASFGSIFGLFQRQFIFLMVIAFIAACPASLYFVTGWLDQFAYHTSVKVTDFIIALGVMVCIVGLVILNYTWRSIRVSPAQIIREK